MAENKSAEWAEFVSGCYKFDVLRFNMIVKLAVGTCIASETFKVGGHEWVIEFYPSGYDDANKGHVGCYLRLVRPTTMVRAMFDLAINCRNGSYSTDAGCDRYTLHTFNRDLPCCGSPNFTSREYIYDEAVNHGSFQIR